MKQSQIVFRLLFPPRQYAAKAVHPTMCPLYNPTTSPETGLVFNSLCLVATRTNMGGITKLFHQVPYLTGIITLIQAHSLRLLRCGLRPFYRNTFYRRLCHFTIMSISPINRQANRHPRTFSKQTAFNAFFGPIRRVWTCFFPRRAGLWPWRRPSIAMTSQSLSTHHNLPATLSKVSEKLQLWSSPEILSVPYCWNKYRSGSRRSIGIRFVTQRESHPSSCDPAPSVYRHQSDEYSDAWVLMARSFPTIHLKSCICFLFSVFSSLNPFKGTIAFEYIGRSGVIRIGT
jgi:hypothetical protein